MEVRLIKMKTSQPEDRHDRLDALVEALLEELGHGKYLLLQEDQE